MANTSELLRRALSRLGEDLVGRRIRFLHTHTGRIVQQNGEDVVIKLDELPDHERYCIAAHISTCEVLP